jgi:hypothetical protein
MKNRALIALVSLLALAAIVAHYVLAADPQPQGAATAADTAAAKAGESKTLGKDVKCPVSGKPVNPADFVEFEKAKVYFCCEDCPVAFKKDPTKYAAKAHLQMVQTEQLKEVACPFTGKKLNPETAIDVGGVKVAFCCDQCKAKAEKEKGDDRVALVFKDTSKGFKLTKDLTKDAEKK